MFKYFHTGQRGYIGYVKILTHVTRDCPHISQLLDDCKLCVGSSTTIQPLKYSQIEHNRISPFLIQRNYQFFFLSSKVLLWNKKATPSTKSALQCLQQFLTAFENPEMLQKIKNLYSVWGFLETSSVWRKKYFLQLCSGYKPFKY